jgi:hypothetical protein
LYWTPPGKAEELVPASAFSFQPDPWVPDGFLNTWLLAGPFDGKDAAGVQRAFLKETDIAPQPGQVAGGDRKWDVFDDRTFIRNFDNYQDLYSYYVIRQKQAVDWGVAYAHVYLWSPQAREAQLRVGFNDGAQAWLNGVEVGNWPGRHYAVRDKFQVPVKLVAGWNRLLLKVTNGGTVEGGPQVGGPLEKLPSDQPTRWVWGFYARVCAPDGTPLPDLVPSLTGAHGSLAIAPLELPAGYVEWPYVAIQLQSRLEPDDARADAFQFLAGGGQPPYQWSVAAGKLPAGLDLDPATGRLTGMCRALGESRFTVQVRDAAGATAQRACSLVVQDRPNRWIEQVRFGSLMHGTEQNFPINWTEPDQITAGERFVRMGLGYVLVKSVYNAEKWIPALRRGGVERTGFYFSRFGDTLNRPFHNDAYFAQIEDLVGRHKPALIWFDEFGFPNQVERCGGQWEYEPMHSIIRALNPVTLILMNNGQCEFRGRGDNDVISAEGYSPSEKNNYWQPWPSLAMSGAHPKRLPIESWRCPNTQYGPRYDWQEWVRVVFSLIGEGYTADLDGTVAHSGIGTDPARASLFQESIANWMRPRPGVDLKEAFVGSQPLPLANAPWGYAVKSGDRVYLYIVKNPRGKSGLPADGKVRIPAAALGLGRIAKATVLNSGKTCQVSEEKDSMVISGITADPVVTVLRLESRPGHTGAMDNGR